MVLPKCCPTSVLGSQLQDVAGSSTQHYGHRDVPSPIAINPVVRNLHRHVCKGRAGDDVRFSKGEGLAGRALVLADTEAALELSLGHAAELLTMLVTHASRNYHVMEMEAPIFGKSASFWGLEA